MALFDAVDRDLAIGGKSIPGNVARAYHAMRKPEVESRWYFGNCGTAIEGPPAILVPRWFEATHAGMGGFPWAGDHPRDLDFASAARAARSKLDIGAPPKTLLGALATPALAMKATIGAAVAAGSNLIVPTITQEDDKKGSAKVKSWMWNNVRSQGMVR